MRLHQRQFVRRAFDNTPANLKHPVKCMANAPGLTESHTEPLAALIRNQAPANPVTRWSNLDNHRTELCPGDAAPQWDRISILRRQRKDFLPMRQTPRGGRWLDRRPAPGKFWWDSSHRRWIVVSRRSARPCWYVTIRTTARLFDSYQAGLLTHEGASSDCQSRCTEDAPPART
jgi:hypothetical protein